MGAEQENRTKQTGDYGDCETEGRAPIKHISKRGSYRHHKTFNNAVRSPVYYLLIKKRDSNLEEEARRGQHFVAP